MAPEIPSKTPYLGQGKFTMRLKREKSKLDTSSDAIPTSVKCSSQISKTDYDASKQLIFTKFYAQKYENPKKWLNKVSGSEEQVHRALISLGRKPNNPKELQEKITEQIKAGIGEALEEADKQRQYTPY